jgi:hypothetical protein
VNDRRAFVRNAALLGAAFAFPGAEWVRGDGLPRPLGAFDGPADEEYWRMVRSQFLVSPRGIYFNTGTIGASPRPVVDAVVEHLRAFETVFDARGVDLPGLRRAVGTLVGAPPQTLVFTDST